VTSGAHIPAQARLAGLLYLVIIVAGVWGEGIARGGMTTAAAIRDGAGVFRLTMGSDLLMALCDAGVAVLLYLLLRPLAPAAALGAMVFRLIQTAVIAANLIVTAAALMLAGADLPGVAVVMELRGLGYDIGLAFFGICNLLIAAIFLRENALPDWLGGAIGLSGLIYLAGSAMHLLAPDWLPALQPAYLVPLVVETAFALWLLARAGRTIPAAIARAPH
jgi:hypothetical protein